MTDFQLGLSAAEVWRRLSPEERDTRLSNCFLAILTRALHGHHNRPHAPEFLDQLNLLLGALCTDLLRRDIVPYDLYLRSPLWGQKREGALRRDGYRCRLCNSPDNLNVHHRTYERRGYERLDDLTTLCRDCHAKHHGK